MFLPSHEDVVRSHQLIIVETIRVEAFGILVECEELALEKKVILADRLFS